ncbi:MAG: hypothetical protein EAZ95_06450 [Bacteroidetes bacterium]|nr:MAG: hypothetical protein EAZ95_06450 [Bacteroidota bacterium]
MPHIFILTCLLLLGACQPTENKKNEAQTVGKAEAHTQDYDCKHCGMPSQDYPQWHAKIELSDKTYWFCSPRCMFSRYHKLKAGEAKKVWVKDYYKLQFIEAQSAFFVAGSQILGPMGADFVPLADQTSAKAFQTEHQGKEIVPFAQVTPQMMKKFME